MPCPLCDDGRTDLPACGYCGPALVVGGVTRPVSKSKAEDMAEWDRRMAEARASVPPVNPARRKGSARRAQEGAGIGASVPPATAESTATAEPLGATTTTAATGSRPKGRRPKKAAKRTSVQVDRAAEQERRNAAYRDWWTSLGRATEGQAEDEAAFLGMLRDTPDA